MSVTFWTPVGSPGFKMASLAITCVPSWHKKSQRSGPVYHRVLPREAYYSCKASTVCVAKRYKHLRQTAPSSDTNVSCKPHNPSLCSPIAARLILGHMCYRQRCHSPDTSNIDATYIHISLGSQNLYRN